MRCKYCGFANGEDDHRCLRCGRRTAFAMAAPPSYSGANALSVAPLQPDDAPEFDPADAPPLFGERPPPLFNALGQKVIPFYQIQRHATGRLNIQSTSPAA